MSSASVESPSIIVDPELLIKSPAEKRKERWEAVQREWPSYLAIAVSVTAIGLALLELWTRA